MTAADESRVRGFFARLSERSRYLRFASPTPQIPERQLARLTVVDGDRGVALAAWRGDELVALAHLVRTGEGETVADIAIVVADAHQRSGLGTRLFRALAREACRRDIRQLEYHVLGDNRPAQRLLRRFGGGLRYASGLGEGRIAVERIAGPCPPPGPRPYRSHAA